MDTPTQQPTAEEVETRLGFKLSDISKQIVDEFNYCEKSVRPWREQKRLFLKLYLNQRKNPKKVGDTLMFSTHQTILAALYRDRLDAEWMWREEEDDDRVEALNAAWEFDYDEMGKAEHDYGKYWDAGFFGTAIEDWSHFDRGSLTPIPDLWDPLASLFDPEARSINGNRLGRGAMRFGGRELIRTTQEMRDLGVFFNTNRLETDSKKVSELQKTGDARKLANGLDVGVRDDIGDNKAYPLMQWMTWIKGARYLVEAGNGGLTVVRLQKLSLDYFPLVNSHIYPQSHAPILGQPGCPDFTEDKQRARAILQNYTLDAAKFDVLPMWLFDKNKIKNRQNLRNFRAGKMIPGEGIDGNTIIPLTKPTIHQFTQGIMQELETNAQKALATPEIQQGILFSQKRSATEIAEASANVDTRYSLTANLFALSEQNAAYIWLDQYKRHFTQGVDKKTIRLIGAFGPKPLPITADTFKFKRDPDVRIESRVVSQAKKREQRNSMVAFANVLLRIPNASLRSFAKDFGRLSFSKAQVERYLPQTIDELRAESENESLNKNTLKGVVIEPTDDHAVHLEIHGKAADTKAKLAHIEAHKKAMMEQRNRPELFSQVGPASQAAPSLPQETGPASPINQLNDLRAA